MFFKINANAFDDKHAQIDTKYKEKLNSVLEEGFIGAKK